LIFGVVTKDLLQGLLKKKESMQKLPNFLTSHATPQKQRKWMKQEKDYQYQEEH
jgi:hypothetical protein